MALNGGSQALDQPLAITPGASADFFTLDASHPTLLARRPDRMLDGVIFGAGKKAIDGVWRRGEQVVSGGQHHAREQIVRRYEKSLASLMS
jgi:cytosine/adenosine deaminase-related metal-dependent hydrolase